jgi:hypothetical protein
VVEALMASVPPPAFRSWYTERWVLQPHGPAEFVASVLVHLRDDVRSEFNGDVTPYCDADGHVTGMPLRLTGGTR